MKSIALLIMILSSLIAHGQQDSLDYRVYHKKMNQAEELIFLKNDSIGGLLALDSLFNKYDFVFVDDCIEAFQLSILYKRNDLAMHFIKKAMDNGFRLENLNGLDCGCPHNFYSDREIKVTIFNAFLKKNKNTLAQYQDKAFSKYLKKINIHLLQEVLNRHIKEQIYKNFIPARGIDKKEYEKTYLEVSNDNLSFIVSQFKKGEYIGEKNIGLIDKKLLKELGIKYLNDNNRLEEEILKKYNIPDKTYMPVCGEDDRDYFGASPLYIILYHNANSYSFLEKYKDEAIKQGYLHPREYASLKLNSGSGRENRINNEKMKLDSYYSERKNTEEINQLREEFFLPKYEVDLKKHELAHKYRLKLFFGFINGTR
jgi:hypothetical protein